MRKITVPTLAMAISLAIFACSESPSSSSGESSSSELLSSSLVMYSSSSGNSVSSSSITEVIGGRACQLSIEELNINGPLMCGEAPSDMADLDVFRADCEDEGGVWAIACPSGETTTCIYEEDEYDKNVLYKLYVEDFSCSMFGAKNADGSDDVVVEMGGACGPYTPENLPLSLCLEFPNIPTAILKLSCMELEAPFVNKCPNNADLACYDPEDETNYYFYGAAASSFTCKRFGKEDL